MSSPRANKTELLNSNWVSIGIQILVGIFWIAYFSFITHNNNERLEGFLKRELPTRVKVIETRLEYYDKILNRMDSLSDEINQLKLEIRVNKIVGVDHEVK